MAVTDRVAGASEDTPRTEALDGDELRDRLSHSTYHLSYLGNALYSLSVLLHVSLEYHGCDVLVKRGTLGLSADV